MTNLQYELAKLMLQTRMEKKLPFYVEVLNSSFFGKVMEIFHIELNRYDFKDIIIYLALQKFFES